MTQQQVQRTHFGPSWPEVTGFGDAPQQAIFCRMSLQKICNCGHSCPACRFAFLSFFEVNGSVDIVRSTVYNASI